MEIGRLNERTTSQIVEINHARDEITALSTEGRRLNEAVDVGNRRAKWATSRIGMPAWTP